MENDWDLHAVVRGFTNTNPSTKNPTNTTIDDSLSCLTPLTLEQDDDLLSWPSLLEPRPAVDELYEICKPFLIPKSQPIISPNIPPKSSSPPLVVNGTQDQQKEKEPHCSLAGSSSVTTRTPHSQAPRSKKRNNMQKRFTIPADETINTDIWTWRKYGQKFIRGSRYPRAYYRCSSSKACPARKRVEQSNSNPNMLVVTYASGHNHSMSPSQRFHAINAFNATQPLSSEKEDERMDVDSGEDEENEIIEDDEED